MGRILTVLAVTLVMLGLAGTQAPVQASHAQHFTICWSTVPFSDILVHSYENTSFNQFEGTGRDLSGSRAQHVTAVVNSSQNTVTIGYTTLPRGGFVPVFASATVNLFSLVGPGVCFSPDFNSCGNFTLAPIACPGGAFSGPESEGPDPGAQGSIE